jgi:shikimate dehydrogenase
MKIYGIVGYPVGKSLSPAMFNAAFKAEGIDAEYRIFDISPDKDEDLENFCYETDLNNIGGFSVTMPYKQAIMQYMDYYDPLAKMIGSVNTVTNEDLKLVGYNTDVTGAIQAIQEKTNLKGKKVLIMGAGGVARAIAYGLKEFGGDVYIFNRTQDKAKQLAKDLNLDTVNYLDIAKEDFQIIINATPVGSLPNAEESLLSASQISKKCVVMDLVTNPVKTKLLAEAEKAGAEIISGERMLLHQACGQFEIWFGKTAPFEVMEKALYKNL